jgi:hypothetical protein
LVISKKSHLLHTQPLHYINALATGLLLSVSDFTLNAITSVERDNLQPSSDSLPQSSIHLLSHPCIDVTSEETCPIRMQKIGNPAIGLIFTTSDFEAILRKSGYLPQVMWSVCLVSFHIEQIQ